MARAKTVHCKHCERHVDECGPLSARKVCEDCGIGRTTQAVNELIARRGPMYDRYLAGVRKSAEETLAWLSDIGR